MEEEKYDELVYQMWEVKKQERTKGKEGKMVRKINGNGRER